MRNLTGSGRSYPCVRSARNSFRSMTSKKIADPSFIATSVTGEENILVKTDAEGIFRGMTAPAMHRAALTREMTRVKSTSDLENEISVFSHFDLPAKIFESQLSRSKSSNQKRSPTRYSSPGKLRMLPGPADQRRECEKSYRAAPLFRGLPPELGGIFFLRPAHPLHGMYDSAPPGIRQSPAPGSKPARAAEACRRRRR